MSLKIAVLADTHLAGSTPIPTRRGEIADTLLLRAVHRLNRLIKPDLVLILGDLIDDGNAPGADESLRKMRGIVNFLKMPSIVIPGNHDGDVDSFYRVFDRPPEFVDVQGVRFVWFTDMQEPNWNARRSPVDLERMAKARAGWGGPILAVQHVPVFPPGTSDCPYNYTNADDVLAAMRRNGIGLAISGHYHPGIDLLQTDGLATIVAPALCESPFSFFEVTIDVSGSSVRRLDVRRHHLRMPAELQLVDRHAHTQFAYCGENVTVGRSMAFAKDFGLAGIVFTEHSGQLYFEEKTYWSSVFMTEGTSYPAGRDDRMAKYFAAAEAAGCPPQCVGLELDCDFRGRPVVRREDRERAAFVIGGLHVLPELLKPQPDPATVADEFLANTEAFVRSGIDVLAHPFRVFRRSRLPVPELLFAPVLRLLVETGTAAEINYHTNDPSPEFARMCIDAGVKLSFGGDSHNLYEVGEFAPHLDLLRRAGYDGDVGDVLLRG